ncbi:MAG: hypothetical protein R3E32_05010 [Chitinophagales bacterium]
MKFYTYLLIVCCFMCFFEVQAQNGWTRKAKGLYAQAAISTFSSNNYYNTDGELFNAGSTFQSRGLLLYGEYGLTDRFTAMLDLPLLMLNSFNTTETVAGIGNAKLGLKYRLLKNIPISLQVDFEVPTDDGIKLSNAKEPNSLGMIDQINLPTSDGEFNVWTTLAASQSTSNGKTFGSVYTSLNLRTESFSNQLQVGLELGHLFFDKLYLIGKVKIQDKLSSDSGSPSASFLYGEGTTFTSYGLTTMYKLDKHLNLVASFSDFTDVIVKRRNIYDGTTFSVGVALEY